MLLMRKQWKEQIPPLKIILENSQIRKKNPEAEGQDM